MGVTAVREKEAKAEAEVDEADTNEVHKTKIFIFIPKSPEDTYRCIMMCSTV